MLTAVHSDRSGRLIAADYGAAFSDGAAVAPLERAIPLPSAAEVVPLPDRAVLGIDRSGHARPLGAARWAVGAVLPPGYLRLGLPAYADDGSGPALSPRGYAAVGADESGALVVSAAEIDPAPTALAATELSAHISRGLRERPSNRLVRQLARCAKEYRCRAAANAFLGEHDAAVPIAAAYNERPAEFIVLRDLADAHPTEPAAFKPTPLEIAEVAAAHLEATGAMVAFGRACEGEPLLEARLIETAIAAIRARTAKGTVHLETNGSLPSALRRLRDAGLDSVAFRIAAAQAATYETIHRPEGFRFTDVRASIAEATARKLAVSLLVLVLPGLTDRPSELDALIALAGELPPGSALLLRDLAADPIRSLALVRARELPIGMDRALERLRTDAAHLRIGAVARPLARL